MRVFQSHPWQPMRHPDVSGDSARSSARRAVRRSISRRMLLRGAGALGAAAALAWAVGDIGGSRAAAQPSSGAGPQIPDTAAGQQLTRWLAAFNAADAGALLDFHRGIATEELAVVRATFDLIVGRTWGEVEVYRLLKSTEDRTVALLHALRSDQWPQIEIGGLTGIAFPGGPPSPTDDPFQREVVQYQMRLSAAADAQPEDVFVGDPWPDDAIGRQMEKYLSRLAATDVFSGAVLVARDGLPFFTAAHGPADQAVDAPNQVSTRFNLAVMNRMFTGIAAAQLAEQGRLAFMDTLAQVLPEYPNRAVAEQITIGQLLTHTSGLGDFYGPRYQQEKDHLWHPWDYVPLFVDAPLAFTPGTGWRFSSAGYIVLGAVVERVSGEDYFDYIRAHIYQPAGMTRSDSFERDANLPDLAIGYTLPLPADLRDLRPEMAFQPRVENTAQLGIKGNPAGGGYSTVEDLLAFDRALRGHGLLGPEYTDLVLTGKVVSGFEAQGRYGYGFQETTVNGARIAGHGGTAPGVNTSLSMFLDRDVTAVVLSNYDAIGGPVTHKIRRLLLRGW